MSLPFQKVSVFCFLKNFSTEDSKDDSKTALEQKSIIHLWIVSE